jgi:hypothetical protein
MSVARGLRKPTPTPLKYVQFVRQLNACICANTDSADEQMNYLLQFTEGEAHNIAHGYSHLDSQVGYDATLAEFGSRYGERVVVAQSYVQKALNWPSVKPDDPKALDAYGIFLRECHYAIDEIDAMGTLEYPENLCKLVGKLPYKLHDRWRSIVENARERGNRVRFDQLVNFVV